MIAADYGLKFDAFIGNYKIIGIDGDEYIISREFYPAKENKKKLKEKTIFLDDFKSKDFQVMAFANVDISKNDSIINYCNKYGLPLSPIKKKIKSDINKKNMSNEEKMLEEYISKLNERCFGNELDNDVFEHDFMYKTDFCRCVVCMKNILDLNLQIKEDKYDIKTVCLLLYFLLFYNAWQDGIIVIKDVYKYGAFKLDEDDLNNHSTKIASFSYYIRSLFKMELGFFSELNGFKKSDLSFLESIIEENKTPINNKFMLNFECDYLDDIWEFFSYVFKSKIDMTKIFFDSNFNITFSQEISFDFDFRNVMKEIAKKILADVITEGLSTLHPKLLIDDKGEYYADWGFTQQYEGMYMQLFLMYSSMDSLVRKCHNSKCQNFFFVRYRDDQKYCCHECAVATAKRKQRAKDKENPNRPRLKPGFQSKKAKK